LDLTQERKKKSIVGYSRQTINHNCEIMIWHKFFRLENI
jgi:hypothetical protein